MIARLRRYARNTLIAAGVWVVTAIPVGFAAAAVQEHRAGGKPYQPRRPRP